MSPVQQACCANKPGFPSAATSEPAKRTPRNWNFHPLLLGNVFSSTFAIGGTCNSRHEPPETPGRKWLLVRLVRDVLGHAASCARSLHHGKKRRHAETQVLTKICSMFRLLKQTCTKEEVLPAYVVRRFVRIAPNKKLRPFVHHTKTCETFTSLSTVPFLTWPFSTTLHVPDFIYFLVYLTFFQKSGIQPKFLKQASFDNSTEVHERSTHLAPPGRSQAPATIHEKDSPEHHSLDARYNHASVWTLQWNCQTYIFCTTCNACHGATHHLPAVRKQNAGKETFILS